MLINSITAGLPKLPLLQSAQEPEPTPKTEDRKATQEAPQDTQATKSPSLVETATQAVNDTQPVISFVPSSRPTSETIVVAQSANETFAPEVAEILPEPEFDESAARAAAEAYQIQLRQTATIESLSNTPQAANIGLQATESDGATVSGNPYSADAQDAAGPRDDAPPPARQPLDKVA